MRRAAGQICRHDGRDGHSVASVDGTSASPGERRWARARGPRSWTTKHAFGGRLSVDVHKMLAASKTRNTLYAKSFVEVLRGRLLAVCLGGARMTSPTGCSARRPPGANALATVAVDPHRGYANVLFPGLPGAVVTVNHFHAVKLANETVNDVRRRVQRESLHHPGYRDDPLYGARRLMTRAFERLTERHRPRLLEALRAGDPDGDVGAAILGEELPRDVYAANQQTGRAEGRGTF